MPNISLFGVSLNPGPFTIKEHVLIMIMANVSSLPAYAVGAECAKLCLYCHYISHATFRLMSYRSRGSSTISVRTLYVRIIPEDFNFHLLINSFTKTDQWLLVMSTQLIGFSICGICKHILVTPPSMIWPETLAYAAIFNALHSQETTGTRARGGISGARFFTYVFVGYFLYSQFPINFPASVIFPLS
jgi:hypothetical protein